MEEWKTFKITHKYINWQASTLGNIRLAAIYNDEIIDIEYLTLGKLLYYCNKDNSIQCWHAGDNIYRIVYRLFKGDINKGWQIHHINFDHTDNRIDNLICVSPREHGKYHSWMFILTSDKILNENINEYDNINNKYVYELIDQHNAAKNRYNELNNIEYDIKNYNNILVDITTRLLNNIKKILNKEAEQKRQLKQQLKEERYKKQIQDKLNTGNYIYDNGKLIYKRPAWTEERRNKTMNTRKTSEAWQQMGSKVSATLKERWQDEQFRAYMHKHYENNY